MDSCNDLPVWAIDPQSAMICSMKVQIWSSGAGEPEGLNGASGMSVRTSLLAGLLHVTPRCNVHTRVSSEVEDCNTGGEGCWKK